MSAYAGLLQGAHAVIAMRRGPHWMLNDQDAKAYGQSLANALRHLPVMVAQKYLDFGALALAIFAYESPRFAMDWQLAQQERQRTHRPYPRPAEVFAFTARPPGPAGGAAAAPPPSSAPPAAAAPPGASTGPPMDMTYEPQLEAGE